MAERLSAVDPAVDELRRKARRRLVGAIVLALAAAVLLPMLLEKEPRSLGEDVAVRIPPVDNGKFVNRLSGESPKDNAAPARNAAPKSAPEPPTSAASTPSAGSPVAPPSAGAPAGSATSAPPATEPAPPPSAAAKSDTASSSPAPTAAPADTKAPSESKSEAKAVTRSKPSDGAFVVQLAAFSDDKGANALASKLKRNGYPAYTEAVQTSRGTLYRVRVGGYPTREAAGDARNKLKGDGYAGIVASAH